MLSTVMGYFSINYILLVMIIGSFLIFRRDRELGRDNTRFLFYVIITTFVLSIVEYVEVQLGELEVATANQILVRKILSWIGYTLRPVATLFFVRIISHMQKETLAWLYTLTGLNALIYATTFVPNATIETLAFTFDAENSFQRGPLGFSVHVVVAIFMVAAVIVVFKSMADRPKGEMYAVLFCGLAGALASFVETVTESITGRLVNPTLVIAGLVYYIFLHTQTVRTRAHEKDVLLSDQRAAMMVSEIEPRFIYGVLNHIKDTTLENPMRTDRTIKSLVGYLDNSMEKTDFIHPIPFAEELDRTKNYIGIEQARFPGLSARLQIEDTDFKIPALTIQHIVDNSINHGFDKETEGLITIKTFGSPSGHTIIVQDNGKGFDQSKQKEKATQGARFGMRNVEERLKRMVNGNISVVSRPNGGTTVMISIPAEDRPDEPAKKQKTTGEFKTVDGVTINPNMPPKQQ